MGVAGIIGAMVGAGFASGREIMQFFSRYGGFSWMLIVLTAAVMGLMMKRVMDRGQAVGELLPQDRWIGRGLMGLLWIAVGGGMTAAAGELWALTVPVRFARTIGALSTLGVCMLLSRRPMEPLEWLERLLIPAILLAFFLCRRAPGDGEKPASVSLGVGAAAALRAVGYCGMNTALSVGVLCEAGRGRTPRQRLLIAAGAAIVIFALLAWGNAALQPHMEEVRDAALPTVMLLRHYGKAGHYLSAAVLYLAVMTTLIAVLYPLRSLMPGPLRRHAAAWTMLTVAAASLCGFGGIVAVAYPALGWLCLPLLLKRTESGQ